MAKKKKMPPKYPFGGIPDLSSLTNLMQGFQGSNTSDWLGLAEKFATEGGYGFGKNQAESTKNAWQTLGITAGQSNKAIESLDKLQGLMGLFDQLKQPKGDSYNPMNFMVNPTRGFQFGGNVEDGEDMAPVHIQAEKGEMISMPDGRIVPVKAKKRHSGMKADQVTDILPPGSFVASRDKRMLLGKKDLEKVILGYPPIEYSEDGTTEMPKEMTAADIMTKDKQTPAEILKIVASKFPENRREGDPFSELANAMNLESRSPYLTAVKHATELKKPKTANPEMAKYGYLIPASQMPENPFTDKLGLKGMEFKRGGKVPHADFGLITQLIGPIMNQLGNTADAFMSPFKAQASKKAIEELEKRGNAFFDRANTDLSGLQSRQMQNLGMGTAAAALPSLLASSDYATPDRSGQFAALAAMPQSVPRSYYDYQMSQARQGIRPFLNMASRNTANAGQAMNMAQASQANMLNNLSTIGNQRVMQDLGLRQSYLNQLGALRGQVAAEDAQKANYQTGFANQRLSNLGSVGANYFNQSSNIDRQGTLGRLNMEGQRLSRTDALRNAQLENKLQLMNAPANLFRQSATTAQSVPMSMFQQPQGQTGQQPLDFFNPSFSSPWDGQFSASTMLPNPSYLNSPSYFGTAYSAPFLNNSPYYTTDILGRRRPN